MEKLENYRKQLDEIDDKLALLFNERMEIVKKIAQKKSESNIPFEFFGREKSVINRVANFVNPEIRVLSKQFFNTVFDTSKAYQSRFIVSKGNLKEELKNALMNELKSLPESACVACQGIEGSYSFLAAEKLFEFSDIVYVKQFKDVFKAVEKGMCSYGVLPIENSSVGSVNAVYDLMKKNKFHIVRSVKLKLNHCLLANKGAEIKNIKEIFSHEQAIEQCSEFLNGLKNVKITVCENTAVASRMVADSNRLDIAAISSKECASLYGLNILQTEISDNGDNFTRFICISKNLEIFKNSTKISLMVNLPHEAGSLNKILSKFYANGLNLTKLESRPMSKSSFEFMFYFDFEADITDKKVIELLSDLDNTTDQFTFLGAYGEI